MVAETDIIITIRSNLERGGPMSVKKKVSKSELPTVSAITAAAVLSICNAESSTVQLQGTDLRVKQSVLAVGAQGNKVSKIKSSIGKRVTPPGVDVRASREDCKVTSDTGMTGCPG